MDLEDLERRLTVLEEKLSASAGQRRRARMCWWEFEEKLTGLWRLTGRKMSAEQLAQLEKQYTPEEIVRRIWSAAVELVLSGVMKRIGRRNECHD